MLVVQYLAQRGRSRRIVIFHHRTRLVIRNTCPSSEIALVFKAASSAMTSDFVLYDG